MQQFYCPNCRSPVALGSRFCANCGTTLNWQPTQPLSASSQWQHSGASSQQVALAQNTSGEGSAAYIPDEIRHWNWGAFLLPFWWGIFNRVWIMLVGFIPIADVIMPFILGAKGNEWAWQKKRWDSIEHFQSTQRTWAKWGIGLAIVLPLLFIIIIGIIFVIDTLSQGPTTNVPPPPPLEL